MSDSILDYASKLTTNSIQNQHLENRQNYQISSHPYSPTPSSTSPLLPAVGLLRLNWTNQHGRIVSINYGTAFAITHNMILTCTHNLYSEKLHSLPSEAIFILGGENPTKYRTYHRCSRVQQIKCIIPKQSFSYSPLKEELAVIMLDQGQSIQLQRYIQIGSFDPQANNKLVTIVGYPSRTFANNINFSQIHPQKIIIKAPIHSIDQHVIHHQCLQTKVGHSGSPIIAQNQQGFSYAIGIHTHRGIQQSFNSGLYFTQQVINTLNTYKFELQEAFRKSKSEPKGKFALTDMMEMMDASQMENLNCQFIEQLYRDDFLITYEQFIHQLHPAKTTQNQIDNSDQKHSSCVIQDYNQGLSEWERLQNEEITKEHEDSKEERVWKSIVDAESTNDSCENRSIFNMSLFGEMHDSFEIIYEEIEKKYYLQREQEEVVSS